MPSSLVGTSSGLSPSLSAFGYASSLRLMAVPGGSGPRGTLSITYTTRDVRLPQNIRKKNRLGSQLIGRRSTPVSWGSSGRVIVAEGCA